MGKLVTFEWPTPCFRGEQEAEGGDCKSFLPDKLGFRKIRPHRSSSLVWKGKVKGMEAGRMQPSV